MIKGQDYTGVTVSYILYHHDHGFLASLRSLECRDEHLKRDLGGGGLKFGESLEDAIHREIKEELDIEGLDLHYMGHRELFRKNKEYDTHRISFQFFGLLESIDGIKNMEPHKHIELKFFPYNELPSFESVHSQFYPALEYFRDELEGFIGEKIVIPDA